MVSSLTYLSDDISLLTSFESLNCSHVHGNRASTAIVTPIGLQYDFKELQFPAPGKFMIDFTLMQRDGSEFIVRKSQVKATITITRSAISSTILNWIFWAGNFRWW
jgi:hypothetical protein